MMAAVLPKRMEPDVAARKLVVEYFVSFPNGADVKSKKEEYKVVKVVDSVLFHPGQMLSKEHMRDLCENTDWTVTVLPRSN